MREKFLAKYAGLEMEIMFAILILKLPLFLILKLVFCPKGCEPYQPLLNKAKDFITLASSKRSP